MILTPFILLTKKGRQQIGLKKPQKLAWLIYSFLIGIGACIITCLIAQLLFDNSTENWYVYISKSYAVSGTGLNETDRLIYFIIYALIGMTFSPIGEEFFYRGIVHDSFAVHTGHQRASIIDSTAFALTHLAHFGIIYIAGTWHFPFVAALIWVLLMFLTSRLFFLCKQKTDSLLGAVICHSGFNLTMMYYIFYYVLR
jgi:membrane protease YdiL (CAAX protease family)